MMNTLFRPVVPFFSNQAFDGRRRVVIENLSPELDGGRYPAKAVVGERVVVSAEVFVDGADRISVELCFRASGSELWQRSPMLFLGNDRCEGSFVVGEPGR